MGIRRGGESENSKVCVHNQDGRLKRLLLSMFDSVFDRLHLQIFKTTLTKLGGFGPNLI